MPVDLNYIAALQAAASSLMLEVTAYQKAAADGRLSMVTACAKDRREAVVLKMLENEAAETASLKEVGLAIIGTLVPMVPMAVAAEESRRRRRDDDEAKRLSAVAADRREVQQAAQAAQETRDLIASMRKR